MLYFEVVSTIALIIGLIVVNVWAPGVGMNVDVSTLDTKGIAKYAEPGKMQSTVDFLLNIIPTSVVDACARCSSSGCKASRLRSSVKSVATIQVVSKMIAATTK